MKKKMTRIISVILFVVMFISAVPSQMVLAVEGGESTEEILGTENEYSQSTENTPSNEDQTNTEYEDTNQNSQSDRFTEDESDVSEEEDAENTTDNGNSAVEEDVQDSVDVNVSDETESDGVSDDADTNDIEIEQNELAEEDIINYIYIESPYLETPGTQRIVFAFENEINEADELTLTVQDEVGNKEDWSLAKQKEGICLFEKEYNDEAYSGVYRAISLNFITGDEKNILNLSDINVQAEFGVNEQYEGYEDLQPISNDQVDEQGGVEASVVTIDENGVAEAQNSIAEALDVVSAETTANTYSRAAAANADTTRSGNIIVALDPGHDNLDAGAQGFGLKEEVLTLKIANYCKEELEQYAGVEVYMTRTSAACPYDKSGAYCIQDRVNAAADAGAQIFVSFHLNSSVSSSVKGAEIIVQNKNWRPTVAEEGEELADAILDELVKVGLTKRPTPIYSKNSQSGDKYQDGSLADYFAVQRYSKMRNIPGIIVEHAFISNADEVNSFLKTEAGLKKLGVADATGIAKYLGLYKIGEKVSITEGTYVLESALDSGKVVTVANESTDNSAAITLNSNNNTSAQRFEITSAGNGYYNIVAENSGKVLDIKGGSAANGTAIQQYTENSTAAQEWGFINAGNGYYYICSALGTYMDVRSAQTANGTQIQSYSFNGTNAQKWKLVKTDYRPIEDGTYTISSSLNKNIVLDVKSASIANMANVQVYTSNNTPAQRFEISYVSNGYYNIRAEHSSKALDVEDGSKDSGANIQQYKCYNSKQQLWKFIDAGNGSYYIRSKCGTVMDIEGGRAISGTNVYTWVMNYGGNQKWNLTKSDYRPVKDGRYVIASYSAAEQVATEKNSNIQLERFDNSDKQKFDVSYMGDGYYRITNADTGKVLDVKNGSFASGANVQLYTWNGSDAQLWKFVDAKNGSYYIKSKLKTTLDLTSGKTASGTNIQAYEMNGTNAQKWILDSGRAAIKEVKIEEGTYSIQNSTNTAQVLDVKSRSLSNKANVQTYTSNNTSAQRFEIKSAGNGYYRIMAEHSGKAVDIKNGSSAAGANVQQYDWNGTDAQLWKFINAGDGKYYIQSKEGMVLDLGASKASSGTNVQTDNLKGEDSQKWLLVKTEYRPVDDGKYAIFSYSSQEKSATEKSGNLQLETFTNSDVQKYNITYVGNGYYKIILESNGKSVDVKNGSSASKANVQLYKWNESDAQLWKFVDAGNGSYYIKSKLGTTMDLTSGKTTVGTNIQMYKMNGTNAQKWVLDKEKAALKNIAIEEGMYILRNASSKNYVLDVKSRSMVSGANIQTYLFNNTSAQHFKITAAGNGYYRISAEHSGMAVDIKNGSSAAGANVQQYKWNGTDAQLWKFMQAEDGSYYIQSKKGTVLDVNAGTAASGSNVQTDTLKKEKTQKWILDSAIELYEIMGKSDTTVSQMMAYFNSKNTEYPYSDSDAPTIEDFCRMYIEECEAEGVRAEVAFCQAMLETGFLKFGGSVDKDQYNFAGLGSTENGVKGESFPTVRIGIRAHVQHLKAYASTDPLNQECVDIRFKYVKRGCSEYVQWLGMQENPNSTDENKVGWAASEKYGYNIVELYILPMKKF